MEKQKKNKKKYKKIFKRIKFFKTIKNKKYPLNLINKKIKNKTKSSLSLFIKVKPNNIFCTLVNNRTCKILISKSAGSYKLNISKKLLRYYHKIILLKFLNLIVKFKMGKTLIVKLKAPLMLRKSIVKEISEIFKSIKILLDFVPLKTFNGCRPKKKKRKKQKSNRVN